MHPTEDKIHQKSLKKKGGGWGGAEKKKEPTQLVFCPVPGDFSDSFHGFFRRVPVSAPALGASPLLGLIPPRFPAISAPLSSPPRIPPSPFPHFRPFPPIFRFGHRPLQPVPLHPAPVGGCAPLAPPSSPPPHFLVFFQSFGQLLKSSNFPLFLSFF